MADSTAVEMTLGGADDEVALLQAVADSVRWAVLEALSDRQLCVCDLQERVPVAGNLLSYHLKVLRETGLVVATRRGRWIDYALADDALARLGQALPGSRRAVRS
ncbi:helix-turn-helix transcriptional regulator [Actinotalea sp. K2]|uniref:ArsR/SmtB family transcription factor n=1 Tax=Actinotalea sp. K2 TaxID=2939438 RepID=UPI002016E8E0|nr:metalloregulator ArsR/SmtB family transcription factor [Actinotalea sp. K2]MCL3862271.1 metalloregulator ArsR/SmtB family transcription factor [Actinotalea sp. K2]